MASAGAAAGQRQSYRGLRGWLDTVDRLGELERVSGADWDVEMGAVTQMLTEKSRGQAPAILFDDVPGYAKGYRTLYGQLSSIKRIALTLGLPLDYERKVDIVQRYHARMQDLKPLPPRFVNDGPIFENVHRRRRHRRAEIPGAAPSRGRQGALHRHRLLRHDTRIPTPAGSISAPIAARSMTARPSAARSPRASTAASIATNISTAASR